MDRVTDIDCFDFNDDGIKDIALIGYSGAELKVLLYESTSDYHYNVFSGWGDVGEAIRKASNDDFSMDTLKSILEIGGGAYLRRIAGDTAKKAILAAEEVTYSDYKSAYIDFLKVLDEYGFDNCGTEIDSYYIYDIDKDKTPELLVEYGIYGNEKHVWVYTYAENKVRRIDMFDTVNSDFYAYPGGNGIMKYWSHGGGEEYCLFSLNNNNLTSKVMYSGCTIYDDPEMGEDYRFTSARDVVPTTYFLTSPDTRRPLYSPCGARLLAAPRRDGARHMGGLPRRREAAADAFHVDPRRKVAVRLPIREWRRACFRQRVLGAAGGLLRALQGRAFQDSHAGRTRAKHQSGECRVDIGV